MRHNDRNDEATVVSRSLPSRLGYHDPRAPMGRVALPAGVPPLVAEGVAWAQFLEGNIDRFQRTLDVPIGKRLGCGRFGCVFESKAPWVVKLTRDESEGPIWGTMQDLLREEEFEGRLPSFLRVHDVVRIRPDVIFNDEQQPVFAIVREEAEPVFEQVQITNPRDKYDVSFEIALSEQSLAIIGATPARLAKAKIQKPVLYKHMAEQIRLLPKSVQEPFAELHLAVQAVRAYRAAALVFHQYRWQEDRSETEEVLTVESHADMVAACAILSRVPLSTELGDTLFVAQDEADLVFRDLHLYNIGWRTHRSIKGEKVPQCMVILDPGAMATPVVPEIREVRLLRNAGMYLRNAGLIDDADVLEPNDAGTFTNVPAETFYSAFENAMGRHNPYSAYVSHYSIPELKEMRARYLSSSQLSGVAVKDHGDGRIEGTALFNEGDPPGSGSVLLQHAIDHAGVNYLECFGDGLRSLYERNGFVVVDRFPFNDEYAPSDWNYGLFGRPDYFTLQLRRQPMDKIPDTAEERRAAVTEMVRNPAGTRASVIESLRRKGLTDGEISREIAIIEATVGF